MDSTGLHGKKINERRNARKGLESLLFGDAGRPVGTEEQGKGGRRLACLWPGEKPGERDSDNAN